jgi:cation diffusion facilitator CzcD-associated flavoprotein CzcO
VGSLEEHIDVLIVGAGISGIGAAYRLQERCPSKSYAILEARDDLGGTWDLFRYPGIRSDTDMYTLGYRFKPWSQESTIADGSAILDYLRETAEENGIDRHIRFGLRVVAASWSTADARWTVEAERTDSGETVKLTCGFLLGASGYYDYEQGYLPEFPGVDRFQGQVIHPQHWPEDVDYEGKRVIIIGSGATAITLVPAMADDAAHVTMLQRSPSWVLAIPSLHPVMKALKRHLPRRAADKLIRWIYLHIQTLLYAASQHRPGNLKKFLRRGVEEELPTGYDMTHFTPSYDPWDQRICFVKDGDLFKSLSDGSAEIVTDRIETFTEAGIKLESGKELEADLIVTATGLNLLVFGGIRFSVDGEPVDLGHTMAYKSLMLDGMPNFAFSLGFSNASWTLKADLVSEFVCRLINHMDANGYSQCVPRLEDPSVGEDELFPLQAGYVLRSIDQLPKAGSREPWTLRQSVPYATRVLRRGALEDGELRFSSNTSDVSEPLATSSGISG